MLLLEKNITKKEQVEENMTKVEFETSNNF